MKNLTSLLFLLLLCSTAAFSQISGDVVKDNRKMKSDFKFEINGHLNGTITIDITVDALGNVSSTKVLSSETTTNSTPAKLKAINHVNEFKFEPGTWFPKFHKATVVITMVKR
ncbi:energy transducer TonB [Brumimicrobium mesophilum]|uniref:hypothetical protein n=1 Tax=Brumimicrobium mesophilum TaxID=392717 RepID=UPI000D140736|nr:hypothetical protein [Brumimicrobium mesophilum]